MAILASVTPLVEQLSIDEAFLDVSGARRLLGTGAEIAGAHPRRAFATRPGSSCRSASRPRSSSPSSRAISPSPTGCSSSRPGTEREFLAPLPGRRGSGASARPRCAGSSAWRCARSARSPRCPSRRSPPRSATSLGHRLRALARNDDPRAVVPEREAKSIGAEETFAVDLRDRGGVRPRARAARRPGRAARLRQAGLQARTVTLKIRFGELRDPDPRAHRCRTPTDVSTVFLATARELLDALDCRARRPPARRLAVAARRRSPTRRACSPSTTTIRSADARVERRGRGRARGRRGARPLRLARRSARRRWSTATRGSSR